LASAEALEGKRGMVMKRRITESVESIVKSICLS